MAQGTLEEKITIFAGWCKNFKEHCYDVMTEGALETAIRQSKDSTINQIGDMIEEILNMDNEQLENELNPPKKK